MDFLINENFRLTSANLSVAWHVVDAATLDAEGAVAVPGRRVFRYKGATQLIAEQKGSTVNLIRQPATNFAVRGFQKWLRELFRDIIFALAEEILPPRVKYWEDKTGLVGSGVKIERLKNSVLGCCSYTNQISLQPFLVLFKQDWIDEIILHEMTHYKFKHHKKAFWDYLSMLLGRDARKSKARKDIELSPFYGYCLYLTKN